MDYEHRELREMLIQVDYPQERDRGYSLKVS